MALQQDVGRMELEIEKTLVVSASHITVSEWDDLYNYCLDNCLEYDDFYRIFEIGNEKVIWDNSIWPECKHFQKLVKLAVENGCTHIKFKMEGPILDGYIIFDWY
jgi:hypothetical protein